ncbi:MAG: aminotransferase class IV [Candidatus Aenigmarchaeota archaeon]|nr:aminotransferase class IV [Candidatus Aenigmarchaeota archaeon]
MIVCINGKFVNEKEAKISVFDHGLLYGDGVFDTIAAINGQIFWLEEHINRLLDGCNQIYLKIPWSKKELINLIEETIQKNNHNYGRIRITITRGEKDIPIYSSETCKPNLIIFSSQIDFLDKQEYEQGIKLQTTNTLRVFPQTKNLSFMPSVLAFLNAKKGGYDDALFVEENGTVREGCTFNIFAIKNKKIKTPSQNVLPGVTALKVAEMATNIGFPVSQDILTLNELKKADEVFITGTTKKIVPVVQIDKTKIGDGGVGSTTKELMNKFSEIYF